MKPHRCAICGASDAPLGFGLPGLRKDLPPKKRGYLWACTAPECVAAAEARRKAAIDREGVGPRKPAASAPSAPPAAPDGTPRLI